jgi:cephalosporin hydroxylase
MTRLVEPIKWSPAHDATMHYDENGSLVLRDGTKYDWHLLRWIDPRLNRARVRLRLIVRPCPTCNTDLYVHHWGNRDVCAITKEGIVAFNDLATELNVEPLPDGFLSIAISFENFHPTLSIGTAKPRGMYAGTGADQYSFNIIEVEILPLNPTRQLIIDRLWRGNDPCRGFPPHLFEYDLQGWNSQHPYLRECIQSLCPQIIVEVGVWKGASTVFMANELKNARLPGVVIAIDTWLGAADHWTSQYFAELNFVNGYPTLYHKFLCNIVRSDVVDYVVPLPLDSMNAAHTLKTVGIRPQVVHIDGGHEYDSVMADIRAWWPLLLPGGLLIGDDYHLTGLWPGVRRAFDEFFGELGLAPFEHMDGKCRIAKPQP